MITCPECGKSFYATISEIERGRKKTCGRTCRYRNRTTQAQAISLETYFWPKVKRSDTCWTWIAGTDKHGYGKFHKHHGITILAHRFSWELANGQEIPRGMDVLHQCDNPPCVRPDHLFLGTAQTNADDMVSKGRAARPWAKITQELADEIRRRGTPASYGTAVRLAGEYGLTEKNVRDILKGRHYRPV